MINNINKIHVCPHTSVFKCGIFKLYIHVSIIRGISNIIGIALNVLCIYTGLQIWVPMYPFCHFYIQNYAIFYNRLEKNL